MDREESVGEEIFQVIKGVGIALAVSLSLVLLFAVLLRVTYMPKQVIYPINQLIKCVSVVAGTLLCVRGEKGFLKGLIIALVFTATSYLAFSALGGDFSLSWMLAVELLIVGMTGALSGSIAVNLRRNG